MAYTIELLHVADQEASSAAVVDAPNLSAVLNALRAQDLGNDGLPDNTLTLSSGDAFIPGVFFDASETVYGAPGIADIQIQNELGFDAIALGNHEFDLGTEVLRELIDGLRIDILDDGTIVETGEPIGQILGQDFVGTSFPYLSSNIDFSTDPLIAPLEVAGGAAPEPNTVTSSVIIDVNGESIGVVGATTPTLASITSPGTLGVSPQPFDTTPTPEQLDALAAEIQVDVDALLAADPGLDKIILLAHMQQISIELELAARLSDVDIIVAGGSNSRLFDENDRPREGDSDQGAYPTFITGADGNPVAVVNTDGSYKYVGRLVIEFGDNGIIDPDSYDAVVSGAYATDAQGVADLDAAALVDPEVQQIASEIEAQIIATESNVFGVSDVFLNGNRSGTGAPDDPDGVRTQETNLGNLTADANLAMANEIVQALGENEQVVVSLKNGGGIRASIGQATVPPGGSEAVRLPNEAIVDSDGNIVKPQGGISENDIKTTLAFNNGLTLVTLTREEIVALLEHGVSALPDVAGQFPQLGGVELSFDPDLPAGDRIVDARIVDENGNLVATLVAEGEIAGDPTETFRVVSLSFLVDPRFDDQGNYVGGGDGYPFPNLNEDASEGEVGDPDVIARANRIDLEQEGVQTGDATFADDGTEQDALAEYLADNFLATPFTQEDAGPVTDARIINLDLVDDGDGSGGEDDAPVPTLELTATVFAGFVGEGGENAAEVVAHEDGLLFVTNGAEDRIDIFDLSAVESTLPPIALGDLPGYDDVQSVAVENGVVAVAISRAIDETTNLSQAGFVALFDTGGSLLTTIDVGNLPDQLTFNADGSLLLVANEGQFNEDDIDEGQLDDPEGSVAVIEIAEDPANSALLSLVGFTQFNGQEDALRAAGVRIKADTNAANDFEPEFIAVSPDGTTAFATLQENNAVAVLDLASLTFTDILPLGTSSAPFDPRDANQPDGFEEIGQIEIRDFGELVQNLRMPDSIASFEVDGVTYFATANEGDSRGFDEDRVGDLVEDGLLDPALVTELLSHGLIDETDENVGLERLEVSTVDGDTDGDGDIDVLTGFSSRSFSIFDAEGNLVFDSGADFERIIAEVAPERFNDQDGGLDDGEPKPALDDNRSDAKGPEPEAIAVGEVAGNTYAFIGLERDSGLMIYDVSDPTSPVFVSYVPPQFEEPVSANGLTVAAASDDGGLQRISPEIIEFIPAAESSSGRAQIAVAYEVSGTTAVYDLVAETRVSDIQGTGHISPLVGQEVRITGIVTAIAFNGYYLQGAGDGDDTTSDGIFVFTDGDNVGISVGDELEVTGTVEESIPGGADTGNLSTTRLIDTTATVLSSGNELPEAVILGEGGRQQSNDTVISEDELPMNLQEDAGTFNPETDAIDFFEALEGMRVTIEDAQAVSPTRVFSPFSAEAFTVANQGGNATPALNERGGINLQSGPDNTGDQNPERVQIQFDPTILPDGFETPALNVGDQLGDVTGVVGYSFGNFEVNVTEEFTVTPSEIEPETTDLVGTEDQLTIAAYNVLNLSVADDRDATAVDQFDKLAEQIALNLQGPDIVALQEIQDDSGVADDGTTTGDATLQELVDAIAAAGGPQYAFFDVAPEDGTQGGVPGGNIRNAYLYNPERVELAGFEALTPDVLEARGVSDPDAFEGSRTPLLAGFLFNDRVVSVVNVHNSSRFGSTPVFGGPQPFEQAAEEAREAQALALNEFLDSLAVDPRFTSVVLGDFNTFEFTNDLSEILPGVGDEQILTNLVNDIPIGEDRYTFIFDGNSQVLDHIFVTENLLPGAEVDIVHVNNDFARDDDNDQFDETLVASDHEPILARLTVPQGTIADVEVGTEGDDVLSGGNGANLLLGLAGDDLLSGRNGNDNIQAGPGADEARGGNGDDVMDLGPGDDEGQGGNGDDTMLGGEGDDSLDGGNGDDTIDGGAGEDRIGGGNGDDVLNGGAQDDEIHGNNGDDTIRGGPGDDLLRGNTGQDTFVLAPGEGTDTIADFEVGDDLIGLADGLLEADLTFSNDGMDTTISANEQDLAVLSGVVVSDVDTLVA